jgi:hypothetical protein
MRALVLPVPGMLLGSALLLRYVSTHSASPAVPGGASEVFIQEKRPCATPGSDIGFSRPRAAGYVF